VKGLTNSEKTCFFIWYNTVAAVHLHHACDFYRKPRSWRRSLWTVPPAVRPELLTRDACYIRLRVGGRGKDRTVEKGDGKEEDEGRESRE